MDSIWTKTEQLVEREALKGSAGADVVIIGAGMAGILTGYFLQQAGKKVIIVEANEIASGQTKNTTAKITSQHSLIYTKLKDSIGEEKTRLYAMANEAAIKDYAELIQRENISCDFEWSDSFLYTFNDLDKIQRETEVAKSFGIDAEFVESIKLPVNIKGATCFHNQAHFHPLKLIKKLSEPLTIYEHTKVKDVEEHKVSGDGFEVEADKIVFMTHYPFLRLEGVYFMRMHQERSYVLALSGVNPIDGMYYGLDDGYSLRPFNNYLLFGGEGHRTGENKSGGRYEALRQKAFQLFPGAKLEAQWSAQDCMTLDDVPYIGYFSKYKPTWYVATGFKKWGMSSSMISARLVSDIILRNENAYKDLFTPQRFHAAASMKNLIHDGAQSIKGLAKEYFTIPESEEKELLVGHGGVVSEEGVKFGEYKDESGVIYRVSTKCSHLGCELTYNPDEKSFDCPCHGSRYNIMGNVIDGPAIEDIAVQQVTTKEESVKNS